MTDRVFAAPTTLVIVDPTVNPAPTIVVQQALTGLPDPSAQELTPLNLYLPLTDTFIDAQTPANQLVYAATLANGQALDGSAAAFGLTFTVMKDGAGLVTSGHITGTPTANGPIDLTVSATDGGPGTPLSITDTFTINVLGIDSLPTGGLTIDDLAPHANELLTVASTVADADGMPNPIDYQWQSSADGIAWTNIAGATAPSFSTTVDQPGLQLRVQGSYIDGLGVHETVTSGATAAVAGLAVITGTDGHHNQA